MKSIDISFPISCIKRILFINFHRLDCQVPIVNKLYKYRCERWLYSSQILYIGYTAYFRVHSAAVLSCSGLFVFNFCRKMLKKLWKHECARKILYMSTCAISGTRGSSTMTWPSIPCFKASGLGCVNSERIDNRTFIFTAMQAIIKRIRYFSKK